MNGDTLQCSDQAAHHWHTCSSEAVYWCPGVTDRQATHVQPDEGAPRRPLTVTQTDRLETVLRELAGRYDDHADDIDLGPAGDPTRRAAAQLRLVAVLYRDGVYDRATAYVWLRSGRRLLEELLALHEVTR